MNLVACTTCRRHIRASERTCPFCASSTRSSAAMPSRLPRALIELGIAATASVGLAACYGAPPRPRNVNDPNDREEHEFRLILEKGALERIDASGPAAGCKISPAGDNKRHLKCAAIEAMVEEDASGVVVRCSGGSEHECRSLVGRLGAPLPAQ